MLLFALLIQFSSTYRLHHSLCELVFLANEHRWSVRPKKWIFYLICLYCWVVMYCCTSSCTVPMCHALHYTFNSSQRGVASWMQVLVISLNLMKGGTVQSNGGARLLHSAALIRKKPRKNHGEGLKLFCWMGANFFITLYRINGTVFYEQCCKCQIKSGWKFKDFHW